MNEEAKAAIDAVKKAHPSDVQLHRRRRVPKHPERKDPPPPPRDHVHTDNGRGWCRVCQESMQWLQSERKR